MVGKEVMKGECPSCYFEIEKDGLIVHEVIFCDDCGCTLEIIEIRNGKMKLQQAEDIHEDWGE